MIPEGAARQRARRGAAALKSLVNDAVDRRRKPRWSRALPGADKGRPDGDPGVGVEQLPPREDPLAP